MEADSFVAALSLAEAEELRALAASNREELTARLKAAGFSKLGPRMKVEALLREAAAEAPPPLRAEAGEAGGTHGVTDGVTDGVTGGFDAVPATDPPDGVPYPPTARRPRPSLCRVATHAEFESMLDAAAAEGRRVVVEFTASWCHACAAVAPAFEELSLEFEARGKFIRVDVEENKQTAARCAVGQMPTFKVYDGRREVGGLLGANPAYLRQLVLQRVVLCDEPAGESGPAALWDAKATDFAPSNEFHGALPGYFFSRGALGIGYYKDEPKLSAPTRTERKMIGNLSWLNEETFVDPDVTKESKADEASDANAAEAAEPAAEEAPRAKGSLERLPPSLARSLYVAPKKAPFSPPLKEGKYADVGHMVKVLDGRHAGKWGLVTAIKLHAFTVEMADGEVLPPGTGIVEVGMHFQSLKTTELKPKYFEIERQKHDRREEQKAWVHKNGVVMPANLTNARLTFNGKIEESAMVVGSAQVGFERYQKPIEAKGPPLPLKKNRVKSYAVPRAAAPSQEQAF